MTDLHQLARDITQLRETLSELREDVDYVIALCEPSNPTTLSVPQVAMSPANPTRAHVWHALTGREAAAAWTALTGWVDWLRLRYQLEDAIPDCWYRHGAIVDELDALRAAWTSAYLSPNRGATDAAFWLEQLGRALPRLREFDRYGCASGQHRDDQPSRDGSSALEARSRHLQDDLADRARGRASGAPSCAVIPGSGDARGDVDGDTNGLS